MRFVAILSLASTAPRPPSQSLSTSEDYCAARPFLADDCSYQLRGTKILGADQIIASYREHGEAGQQKFDQVAYESSVEITGEDSAILHYTDTITHGGETHLHQCRQHILLDGDGRINSILHEDLAGEVAGLTAFKNRHRPSPS
jgi:hypothetical protein